MAVTNEQLVAVLSAQVTKFEKAMDKAAGKADRSFTKIERRGKTMEKRLAAIAPNFRSLLGPLAGGGVVRGFQQFADAATRIENSLKVAGLEGDALEEVFQRLEQSAKNNFAPMESLTELYSRAALVQKELGITSEELLGFTDKIALALRVSGKSASQTSGALLQLSQALGSGVVRAEEFNSILEGALPIAQAAAAGLKEAGGSVAKLRQLVVDGKVSSEAFFRAFEAGSVILEDKVAGATITTGQAFENLKTVLIASAREVNHATGATQGFSRTLQVTAYVVENAADGFTDLIASIGSYISYVERATGQTDTLLRSLQAIPVIGPTISAARGLSATVAKDNARKSLLEGLNSQAARISKDGVEVKVTPKLDEDATKAVTDRIAAAFGESGEVKAVSLKDFKLPASEKKGSKKKTPAQQFGDDIARIKARTLALQAETEAQAGLNPLINDYEYAVTKAATVQDLLNEAKKAGLTVTPELRAKIEQLAEAYAQATVEAGQLEESQAKVIQRAEEFNALGKDVLGGFISDMRQGKSAADALANSLNKIADKLLDMALNNLFSVLPGGSGYTGGFRLPSFAGGGSTGGGARVGGIDGKGGYPAIVHPKETVIDHTRGGAVGSSQVVNVYNSTGQPVERQTRRGSDGTEVLDIWIGKSIASGKQDKAMGGRYGMRAQPMGIG